VFRSVESEVYEISVSLAKTYHVPLWDVYMVHVEFLFDENESQYAHLLSKLLLTILSDCVKCTSFALFVCFFHVYCPHLLLHRE